MRPRGKIFVIHGFMAFKEEFRTVSVSFSINDATSILYAIAYVHPDDMFNRKIGREVSQDKLQKEPQTITLLEEGDLEDYSTIKLIKLVCDKLSIGYM